MSNYIVITRQSVYNIRKMIDNVIVTVSLAVANTFIFIYCNIGKRIVEDQLSAIRAQCNFIHTYYPRIA